MAYLYIINQIGGSKTLTADDKLTYKEIVSQLKWLIEYFKSNPIIITDPDYNQYINMNIILLSKKSSAYKNAFKMLLEQLPDEVKYLYGLEDLC